MSAPAARGPTSSAPKPATPKKASWKIWLPFVVAAVIVVIILAGVELGKSTNSTTLESQGTSWQIPSGEYEVVSFSISKNAAIGANVQSSNGIAVYAFTPSAYSVYRTSGTTSVATWTSGPIVAGSFSVSLGAGSWDLVFVCPNPALTTSVLFTGALTATATS